MQIDLKREETKNSVVPVPRQRRRDRRKEGLSYTTAYRIQSMMPTLAKAFVETSRAAAPPAVPRTTMSLAKMLGMKLNRSIGRIKRAAKLAT